MSRSSAVWAFYTLNHRGALGWLIMTPPQFRGLSLTALYWVFDPRKLSEINFLAVILIPDTTNALKYRMNENSPEKGGLGACVENVRCAQGFSSTNNVVSNGPIKSLCNVTHGRNLFSVFSIWIFPLLWLVGQDCVGKCSHWRLSN